MPKALWSTSEKNLFFEALNEYGKDFDSITAYICNKMKKKGVPDNMTKKKHQVSHFYYRTWQKVSKHIKFGDGNLTFFIFFYNKSFNMVVEVLIVFSQMLKKSFRSFIH